MKTTSSKFTDKLDSDTIKVIADELEKLRIENPEKNFEEVFKKAKEIFGVE